MSFKEIFRALGFVLFGLSATLLIPLILAIYFDYYTDFHPHRTATGTFLGTILICTTCGCILHQMGKSATGAVYRKEGLAIVVFTWLLLPFFGSLPFLLSGTLENPFAAYFEATSAWTTTGSTVLEAKLYNQEGKEIPYHHTVDGVIKTNYSFYGTVSPVIDPSTGKVVLSGIEAVNEAVLFWRSFMQWLGGGGIVVLFVAILPVLGVGGRVLFQTEVTGPIKDTLTPRVKDTAIAIWKIYIGLTLFQIALLIWTNPAMKLFDATTIAFAAISTGGLSVHNLNIGYYENQATDWAVIICMFLGSINFSVYFFSLQGKFYKIFRPEILLYLAIASMFCIFISWNLIGTQKELVTGEVEGVFSLEEAFRYGSFHAISALTSSGFFTANYDVWPYISQVLLVIAMFVGGMSGSTAGGIKIMRHYLLFLIARHKVESLFNPEKVHSLKVGEKEVDNNAVVMTLCFFFLLIVSSVASTLFFVLQGIDPETALGLVACMVNNTGMTFRVGSPLFSCAFLSDIGYLLSSGLMILGRLEFFAIFALLVPSFWKKRG